ncbi:MAG: hypothetical protein PUF50_05995 [Erysipelotrichaceae bacterium]|nr:hypothetical protein [Erysipelotrichaceae bacterium]
MRHNGVFVSQQMKKSQMVGVKTQGVLRVHGSVCGALTCVSSVFMRIG